VQPTLIAERYRVVRAAGTGGMGTVWLCRDEVLHRSVAVKRIGLLPGQDATHAARALREARLGAALNHRHAVSIFDIVDDGDATWLVMEYVPSQTLSHLISARGRIPPGEVARIGAQVAEALAAAHELAIVHRDVKPGNILVADDGTAKLADFGIARGEHDQQLTQTGLITGTPAFLAPEVARGSDPTPASDMWALGVTLYTAVEGVPPFAHRDTPLAMLGAVVHDRIPRPRRAGELRPVLSRLLDRDQAGRIAAADAAAELQALADQHLTPPTAVLATLDRKPDPAQVDPTLSPAADAVDERSVVDGANPTPTGPKADRSRVARGWLLAVLTAVSLLVVGGVAAAWQIVRSDPGPSSTGAPGPAAAAGSSADGGGPASASVSSQDAPTDPSQPATSAPDATPTTDSEAGSSVGAIGSPGAAEQFTEEYYSTMPDDIQTGWTMIAPSMRRDVTHAGFVGFWRTIAAVRLGSVDALDGQTVQYEITYVRDDGTTSTELKELTLEMTGNAYRIASDETVG
jgi:eukaryotic-like serine/threonine-protein kinase